jgi:hypothetical protein
MVAPYDTILELIRDKLEVTVGQVQGHAHCVSIIHKPADNDCTKCSIVEIKTTVRGRNELVVQILNFAVFNNCIIPIFADDRNTAPAPAYPFLTIEELNEACRRVILDVEVRACRRYMDIYISPMVLQRTGAMHSSPSHAPPTAPPTMQIPPTSPQPDLYISGLVAVPHSQIPESLKRDPAIQAMCVTSPDVKGR